MGFVKMLEAVVAASGRLTNWLFPVMVLLITLDVVGRRFVALPTIQIQELEQYANAGLFMLTLAPAWLAGAHVGLDVLSHRWSPRVRAVVELLGILFFVLPFAGIMLWQTFRLTRLSWLGNEASNSPDGLPNVWLMKALLPLGSALILLAAVVMLARAIATLREGRA